MLIWELLYFICSTSVVTIIIPNEVTIHKIGQMNPMNVE